MGGGRVVEAGGRNRGLVRGGGGRGGGGAAGGGRGRETRSIGGLRFLAAAKAALLLRLLAPSTAFLMLSCFSAAIVCEACYLTSLV